MIKKRINLNKQVINLKSKLKIGCFFIYFVIRRKSQINQEDIFPRHRSAPYGSRIGESAIGGGFFAARFAGLVQKAVGEMRCRDLRPSLALKPVRPLPVHSSRKKSRLQPNRNERTCFGNERVDARKAGRTCAFWLLQMRGVADIMELSYYREE